VVGAVVGGCSFILPGLVVILGLAALFLSEHPPLAVAGAALGAGAAVPVVAVHAARGLVPASLARAGQAGRARFRWGAYAVVGGLSAALLGPWLVLVLAACGGLEILARHSRGPGRHNGSPVVVPLMAVAATGGLAAVGYAAGGVGAGILAAVCAFTPSFVFVTAGARHFDAIRADARVQSFLTGAGPAAIGAIAGSAIPLALAIAHVWQLGVLALVALWLLVWRRGVVTALVGAAALGLVAALAGAPV
jgi:chromate transporter